MYGEKSISWEMVGTEAVPISSEFYHVPLAGDISALPNPSFLSLGKGDTPCKEQRTWGQQGCEQGQRSLKIKAKIQYLHNVPLGQLKILCLPCLGSLEFAPWQQRSTTNTCPAPTADLLHLAASQNPSTAFPTSQLLG